MELTAVLIDTVSNQEYIFSGNRLKENLGGSYLLKTTYTEPLEIALDKVARGSDGIDTWRSLSSDVALKGGAEVGYIGGGNTLVFFETTDRAKRFVQEFSRILLKTRPGLKIAFGVLSPFDLVDFQKAMTTLHESLQTAKNRSCPRTIPPRHGITAVCPYSGEAIEVDREDKTRKIAVSALSFARLSCADASTKALTLEVQGRLEHLSFTDDIGKLGQVDSKNYAAVVHVDGNDMGKHFMKCPNLGELRKRSAAVSNATNKAFSLLVDDAVQVVNKHLADDEGFPFNGTLPLRPIIIGGDDITFVCEGRLGLYFAERFMKHIEIASREAGFPFTACAGIAIVKSKYPFFKAYQYAEELCAVAKRESRNNGGTAYLDFLISSGGFSGSIDHIRERHFTTPDGRNLHYGPYQCNGPGLDKCTATLRAGVRIFQDKDKWSQAHAMRLRELLTGNPMQCQNFVSVNNLQLPDMPGKANLVAQLRSSTPYYDMLDTMDFYPQVLLEEVER